VQVRLKKDPINIIKLDGAVNMAIGKRDPRIETGKINFQSFARAQNMIKKSEARLSVMARYMS